MSDYDLVCLSHLRWDFVFQRPQHLLSRFARVRRVLFVEEPKWHSGPDEVELAKAENGVQIAVPWLNDAPLREPLPSDRRLRALLDALLSEQSIVDYVLWYYTPMAVGFTDHLNPLAVVYDCMDELSGFAGAPPDMGAREAELLARADLVTVGGHSLFEAKRHQHGNIHFFPSSIDVTHFARARSDARGVNAATSQEPDDQAAIPHPRIGYAGVIDERMDLELLKDLAFSRPDLHFCMVGPIAKIDPLSLPTAPNIHWLGPKPYARLPSYLSGWNVGVLPFAHNSATRFISPTKTPEYLAAGLPVVSTSISDVVRPYGQMGLVRIADDPATFGVAIDAALNEDVTGRQALADAFLSTQSWDETAAKIALLVDEVVFAPAQRPAALTSSSAVAVAVPGPRRVRSEPALIHEHTTRNQ